MTDRLLFCFFDELARVGYAQIDLDYVAWMAEVDNESLRSRYPQKESFFEGLLEEAHHAGMKAIETSADLNFKDTLFEFFMARIDALMPYKPGLVHFADDLRPSSNSFSMISVLWNLYGRSMNHFSCMLGKLNLRASDPLRQKAREHALWITDMRVGYVWLSDVTDHHSQTMSYLDQSLDQLKTHYGGIFAEKG